MIARLICKAANEYREKFDVNKIALSGGVFNNKLLTEAAICMLSEQGFAVYINELVPCGDGGIALGQAFIESMEV